MKLMNLRRPLPKPKKGKMNKPKFRKGQVVADKDTGRLWYLYWNTGGGGWAVGRFPPLPRNSRPNDSYVNDEEIRPLTKREAGR